VTTLDTSTFYYSSADSSWHNFDEGLPTFPVNPGVVVNEARLAGINYLVAPWAAGYSKIINTSGAENVAGVRGSMRFSSLSYNAGFAYNQGTRILGGSETGSVRTDGYYVMARDDGVACAVQAYLWRITGNVTYRNNAIAILGQYANVTSFAPGGLGTGNTEYKPLQSGWAMEGFTQALSVLGDFAGRDALVSNFVTYWWPSFYHWQGGNWLATFANARLGIAVAAGDRALWDASVAYYDTVIKADIWLTSDGALVNELPVNQNGGAAQPATAYPAHWWDTNRIAAGRTPVGTGRSSAGLVNGEYCELERDDGHVVLGMLGLTNGALTIEHQTGTGLDIYGPRLIAAWEVAAAQIIEKLDASIVPNGGYGWQNGWTVALATFGASNLPNVAALVTRNAELPNPQTSTNHIMQGLLFPIGT
jgi:hypothetical protein